eukprot:3613723-Prymnesium_polylepis.3
MERWNFMEANESSVSTYAADESCIDEASALPSGRPSSTWVKVVIACSNLGRSAGCWCQSFRSSVSHSRGIVLGTGGRSPLVTLALMSIGP